MTGLRKACLEDGSVLSDLHRQCFAEAWSAQDFLEMLVSPGVTGWIAELSAKAAGFVVVRTAADEAEILTLGVIEAARRRGIARLMLEAAGRHVRLEGANAIFLEVETGNAPARALYSGLGFRQVGRRPAYYGGGRAAGLILRADLPLAVLGNGQEVD